ncbi:phospholipid methyltransferase [Lentinula aciculospora]|uniref:Phosphatidyl-N-methylethanolamine N-methyltransferase n=1 Tax=Lentinula aciculospora TaxID=153920 RepID=A0A9W9A2R2_9AGAR|nr:phospholipid methyltransferase [Lentinula aciculospora]
MDLVKFSLQLLQVYIPFDPFKPSLWISLISIAFSPAAWNIIARNEHRNHTLTCKVFGGNAGAACYCLAAVIFSLGMLRDGLYRHALLQQPHKLLLPQPWNTFVGAVCIFGGQILVLSSTWQLGITGTYMGDYFGILKDSRVNGFPFNILQDPMYVGSTICFTGGAFWGERPVGLLVSLWVYLVYAIAMRFEGPFTDMIYSGREELVFENAEEVDMKKKH